MRRHYRTLVALLGIGAMGSVFEIAGCSPVAGLLNAISGTNPCGTVLFCDPSEYQFITSGINGPGTNPNVDIFCTYAPFCGPQQDPIFGGLFGGNP